MGRVQLATALTKSVWLYSDTAHSGPGLSLWMGRAVQWEGFLQLLLSGPDFQEKFTQYTSVVQLIANLATDKGRD